MISAWPVLKCRVRRARRVSGKGQRTLVSMVPVCCWTGICELWSYPRRDL